MSQPCGFLSDLLSCPYRQTIQTLVAPAYTCPMCNGAFADRETIEMVQGPWGCNQMIRNHVGGNYAIPGQWGNAPLLPGGWGGAALASGYGTNVPLVGGYGGNDHRLTGPYGPRPFGNGSLIANPPVISNAATITNGRVMYEGCSPFEDHYLSDHDYDWAHGGSRRKSKHKSKYKYRYSNNPATNCTVM